MKLNSILKFTQLALYKQDENIDGLTSESIILAIKHYYLSQ